MNDLSRRRASFFSPGRFPCRLTKQGTLKYETDVAPNNGYFFLPVYDNGDYVIKVRRPYVDFFFSPVQRAELDS
jgi:hypothetical protein